MAPDLHQLQQDAVTAVSKVSSTTNPNIRAAFDKLDAFNAAVADILQPPVVTPPPATGFPKQGVTAPLGDFTGKDSATEDWMLDQIVALGNGHDMFLRTDWWPNNPGFQALALKIAARPTLKVLPILNYDVANRPTVAVFATQAAQLAQLYPIVNLLNEPNLGGWTPQDAAAYTKAAYTAIGGKAVVVGPSCGFNKGSGHDPANVLAWNQAYHDAGGKQDWGAVTCYGDAQYIDPSWNGWSVVPQIKALLGSKFIVLEDGWKVQYNTDGTEQKLTPYNRASMTDSQYQQICVQTAAAAVAAGRIDAWCCYSLLDDASPGGYGLLDKNKVQRPAYGAFKAAAA